MKDKTYHAYPDSHERQIVIHSLVWLKNRLIQQGRQQVLWRNAGTASSAPRRVTPMMPVDSGAVLSTAAASLRIDKIRAKKSRGAYSSAFSFTLHICIFSK